MDAGEDHIIEPEVEDNGYDTEQDVDELGQEQPLGGVLNEWLEGGLPMDDEMIADGDIDEEFLTDDEEDFAFAQHGALPIPETNSQDITAADVAKGKDIQVFHACIALL